MEGAYPPYNFINKSNQLERFDVEIAQEVAKRLGVKAVLVSNLDFSLVTSFTRKGRP
jgi:polar amino acid transport system substrate-binding protein